MLYMPYVLKENPETSSKWQFVVIFFAWYNCLPNSSKHVNAFHKIWWCHILEVADFFFFLQKINWCVVEVQSGILILILIAPRRFNLHSMKVVWRSFTDLSVNEVLASSYLHDHSESSSSVRFLAANDYISALAPS